MTTWSTKYMRARVTNHCDVREQNQLCFSMLQVFGWIFKCRLKMWWVNWCVYPACYEWPFKQHVSDLNLSILYFNEGWKHWCRSRSAQLILESNERRFKTSVFSICKSCNAHQGFHDIFLISEAWTYVSYEAQTAEIRHWRHPKWHCTIRRAGPAGNSGEMSIEFNDKSKNLFRSIPIQSCRASRTWARFSILPGRESFPLAFSARQDRKPGWIMAHEDWVWTCRA